MLRPRVLLISAEVEHFARTGGLGDSVAALARALAVLGADVVIVTPLYGVSRVPEGARYWDAPVHARVGWGPNDVYPLGVLQTPEDHTGTGRHRVCLLANTPLFGRHGIYGDEHGTFGDNALRFAVLSRGALEVAAAIWPDGGPDIVHAHDWHAAPAILYGKLTMGDFWRNKPAVFTIHNLAYQGVFGAEQVDLLGFPRDAWTNGWIAHDGNMNWMKGAIELADRVTTVSRTYANEILTPAHGCGLDAHLRWHSGKLVGILNGIDTESFDPQIDRALPRRFGVHNAKEERLACKKALLDECGLDPDPAPPLFASVSRLVPQKGIDMLLEIVPAMVQRGARLVFVGTGEPGLEEGLRHIQRRFPGRVASRIAFDDALARRIFAGSNFFVVPSRFEPCGLTQMYAMRYGSVPIVTPVGGLLDTVIPLDRVHDEGTGIVASAVDPGALLVAVEDALAAYADSAAFSSLVTRAMRRDSSWNTSAKQYLDLYTALMSAPRPGPTA